MSGFNFTEEDVKHPSSCAGAGRKKPSAFRVKAVSLDSTCGINNKIGVALCLHRTAGPNSTFCEVLAYFIRFYHGLIFSNHLIVVANFEKF